MWTSAAFLLVPSSEAVTSPTDPPFSWVTFLSGGGLIVLLGVAGGIIKWVKDQLDRNDDGRRNERDYWTRILGIEELNAEHRRLVAEMQREHREEVRRMIAEHRAALAQQREEYGEMIDAVRSRVQRGSVRIQAWADEARRDLVALGGRDPGPPPPIYATDDPPMGTWHEERHAPEPPLPRRNTADER